MGKYVDMAGKTVKEDDPDFESKAQTFIPLTVQELSRYPVDVSDQVEASERESP